MNTYAKRTIWRKENNPNIIQVIDQRRLPHELIIVDIHTCQEIVDAIKDMTVRGAPLIGATAGYGVMLACIEASKNQNSFVYFEKCINELRASRPTAINLFWAIERQLDALKEGKNWQEKIEIASKIADQIIEDDIEVCRLIGVAGLPILEKISQNKKGDVVNILTHCNAGRLGCIEWGTISSPIYQAHQNGMKVHVWVDETRPRNQGANLTAWELTQAGVPHTVIVDNAGGHLMQHGMVDVVFVGTDRTTRMGDVANKIGTYLKALAAFDNQIPFYVALPSTTIDWTIKNGLTEIPIEERSQDEVKYIYGWNGKALEKVLLTPITSKASNYGFDVTPARLITGLMTERGICNANEEGLLSLFPEYK